MGGWGHVGILEKENFFLLVCRTEENLCRSLFKNKTKKRVKLKMQTLLRMQSPGEKGCGGKKNRIAETKKKKREREKNVKWGWELFFVEGGGGVTQE